MKKRASTKSRKTWGIVSAILAAILITLTILEHGLLHSILGTVLGGPMPIKDDSIAAVYKSDYQTKRESKEAGDKLNVEIAGEGFVLLLNENHALPIATPESDQGVTRKPRVSVFGKKLR